VREALSVEELRGIYARIAKRYDLQHGIITARADERGRRFLVDKTVREGDRVLDCGSGTGATGVLAAKRVGPQGKVTLFDLSDHMLAVARRKVVEQGMQDRVDFEIGDMVHLPFEDDKFDVVLSTYSLCPLYDPKRGALELYRVTRSGGMIGVAHSTVPKNPLVRWFADRVEDWAWRFPRLSMGCRSVEVLPTLKGAGAVIQFSRTIGIPLWPFLIFVAEKPPR
jgi:demethylmenaquinone methyltransferase / 2-methoxy-6-polyprenyl-1,4-benzoquinol methylase